MPAKGSTNGTSKSAINNHRAQRREASQRALAKMLEGVKAASIVGLGLIDAKGAARFVLGEDAPTRKVNALAKLAMSDAMKEYRDGEVASQARLASTALSLSLQHAIESIPLVPPQSVAMHTKLIRDISESLGGSDAMYTAWEMPISVTVID